MEARELRYFVAVAEELHFSRAAERLGVAQPPLSRAVGQLERRLGVVLLERTSRRVTLTDAGQVLLVEGRAVLSALAAAERRTVSAATGPVPLVLAAKAGASDELLTKLLDAYSHQPGAVPVRLLLDDFPQQRAMVLDGRADAALMHLPYDCAAGLDSQELSTEGQVAVLPASHGLAARRSLRAADVAGSDLPLARWPTPDGAFPDGPGPQVHNLVQLFQLVALGRAVAVVPKSAGTDLRQDLAAVDMPDAPLVTTIIAWPPASRSVTLAELVRLAAAMTHARAAWAGRAPGAGALAART